MADTYFYSDPHLTHQGILRFKRNDGSPLRDFENIEEHDEYLISQYNAIVKPHDRVYWLGDVAMNRSAIKMVSRFNGKKVLVRGNHDIFRLEDYTPYFEDLRAYKVYPKHGIICSHIPVHPQQLENRFTRNVHGHLHSNRVMKEVEDPADIWCTIKVRDERYVNICVEQTDYAPISFDEVLKRCNLEPQPTPKGENYD